MKHKFKIGEEVDFHGRSGTVKRHYKGYVDVYFDDTGDEESIDDDELNEQNSYNQQLKRLVK